MPRIPAIFSLLLALAFMGFAETAAQVPPLGSPDPEGTWEFIWDSPEGLRTMIVTLERDGASLRGSVVVERPPLDENEGVPIFDASIEGIHFTFKVDGEAEGRGGPIQVYGVMGNDVAGGYITGTPTFGEEEVPFRGWKRTS